MNRQIPRPEHPRPAFMRDSWVNLNGEWEFFNDLSASGVDRRLYEDDRFDGKITVPFCPESKLSGVGFTDFMPSVWYARNIDVDEKALKGRVLLHFGACFPFLDLPRALRSGFGGGEKSAVGANGATSLVYSVLN